MFDFSQTISWWTEDTTALAWRILWAFVAFAFILFVAKFVAAGAQRLGQAASKSIAIGNLFAMLVRVIAALLALYVALRIFGLDSAAWSVLAGAGVAGIVIGFALQDIAANFISGVVLAIQRPFRVGHLVETNDTYGVVKKIYMRSTEIQTLDGQLVHIPNKNILLQKVSDYNYIPYRRVDLTIGVGYNADLDKVKKVTLETIKSLDLSDEKRAVELYFTEFAASSINFDIRFWTKFQTEPNYLEARSQAVMEIHKAYAKHNIEIPYPITTVFDAGTTKSRAASATQA